MTRHADVNPALHDEAMAIIAALVEKHRAPPRQLAPGENPFKMMSTDQIFAPLPPVDDAYRFRRSVKAWLRGIRMLDNVTDSRHEEYVWKRAVRPWLEAIVGWYAPTALGRAAGERGFHALVDVWQDERPDPKWWTR